MQEKNKIKFSIVLNNTEQTFRLMSFKIKEREKTKKNSLAWQATSKAHFVRLKKNKIKNAKKLLT